MSTASLRFDYIMYAADDTVVARDFNDKGIALTGSTFEFFVDDST